tara:strand:- start:2335 stop:2646 length:312 start_codon:yes stop_codon:yes gene_type:complete
LLLLFCNVGLAEYSYKTYRENPSEFEEYFHGLGDGMGWSITMQEQIGPKFFCQPRNLAISTKEYVEMFENQADEFIKLLGNDEVDKMSLGLILAYAHKTKFPC